MNITIDRTLLEQAIESMRLCVKESGFSETMQKEIDALVAALDEPAVELTVDLRELAAFYIAEDESSISHINRLTTLGRKMADAIVDAPPPPAEPAVDELVIDRQTEWVTGAELTSPPAEPAVEPVAVVYSVTVGPALLGPDGTMVFESTVISNQRLNNNQKLYTSPPPPAEPAVEPAKFVYVDHLGGTEVVIRDPQLPKATQAQEAATTPETLPPPPAEVPMLSDEDIAQAWSVGEYNASAATKRRITRAIEVAYRRKAGL